MKLLICIIGLAALPCLLSKGEVKTIGSAELSATASLRLERDTDLNGSFRLYLKSGTQPDKLVWQKAIQQHFPPQYPQPPPLDFFSIAATWHDDEKLSVVLLYGGGSGCIVQITDLNSATPQEMPLVYGLSWPSQSTKVHFLSPTRLLVPERDKPAVTVDITPEGKLMSGGKPYGPQPMILDPIKFPNAQVPAPSSPQTSTSSAKPASQAALPKQPTPKPEASSFTLLIIGSVIVLGLAGLVYRLKRGSH